MCSDNSYINDPVLRNIVICVFVTFAILSLYFLSKKFFFVLKNRNGEDLTKVLLPKVLSQQILSDHNNEVIVTSQFSRSGNRKRSDSDLSSNLTIDETLVNTFAMGPPEPENAPTF